MGAINTSRSNLKNTNRANPSAAEAEMTAGQPITGIVVKGGKNRVEPAGPTPPNQSVLNTTKSNVKD
jgi:hypothetical protein